MIADHHQNMQIVHLLDTPEAAPILTRWFIEAWMPWYGPKGQGDAAADLAACCSRDHLPICLVALDTGTGEVLGTAGIRTESVGSELEVGPWLAAMLVGEAHRGRGIGTALVEAIEGEAARLGFGSIYSSTDPANRILERLGWRPFGEAESLRGSTIVYRRSIAPDSLIDPISN
jgi:GNAT superfamily N-acetyltransferase